MLTIDIHHLLLFGVVNGECCGQLADEVIVIAIEASIVHKSLQHIDFPIERETLLGIELAHGGEILRNIVLAHRVVDIRTQGLDIGRVHLDCTLERCACHRVATCGSIGFAQLHHKALVVGGLLDRLLGFVDCSVELPCNHIEAAFQDSHLREFTQSHLCRVDYGYGREWHLLLLVEHRHNAVVVGILIVDVNQSAIDGHRLGVVVVDYQRLAIKP